MLDGTDELDDGACADEVSLSPPSVVLNELVSVTDGGSESSGTHKRRRRRAAAWRHRT